MMTRKLFYGLIVLIILGGLILVVNTRPSTAQSIDPVEQLQLQTDGTARVSYHSQTGQVRFIGTDRAHPMPQPMALPVGATTEEAARQFLNVYSSAFGLIDQAQELLVMRAKTMEDGREEVRFQQVYQGIPVVGAELIVQMDVNKQVLSVSGEILPSIKLDVIPSLEAGLASQLAIAAVSKAYAVSADSLTTSTPELWIYNPLILGGPGPQLTSLVWRMEVTPQTLLPIREFVLVDVHTGFIALHFNRMDTVKNRETYTTNNTTNLPGTLVCNESNPNCSAGDTDAKDAHIYAGATYDFYLSNHGRDSIDNAGMKLISTVHYDTGYENAFWDGSQMVYGDGYGFVNADDVVAHELTHGITDYESKLFYYYQSGAINESFSDLWGEFVDQDNGLGDDSPEVKWLMGEDVTGYGAMRSMSDPADFGDPDKMSSNNYYCAETDQGGVHTNNGVNNKAVYLMTDGGTFNEQTIIGLGISKVAKIYYEVQTNLLTTASDYQDLYDNLQQACTNLIGTATGITAADCQQVKNALLAVEMNTQPVGCAAPEAPICTTGQTPNTVFFDDLENPASGRWSSSAVTRSINQWYYPQNPNSIDIDATYATSGIYNFWGYDTNTTADYAMAMNSNVLLPAGATYMHFRHAYDFEGSNYDGFDGGVLEYSANGGAWTDAGGLLTDNGYKGVINSSYENPLGGRSGFIAQSNGYVSSRLDLSTLAGQNIKFRFRIGTDSSGGDYGWFIDDIRIYSCLSAATKANYLPQVRKDRTPTPIPTPTSLPAPPNTIYSISDSTVVQGHPGTNYGNFIDMVVGYDKSYYSPSLKAVRSLVKFDLSAIPAGTNISSATLNIYFMEWTDVPGKSRTIRTYRISSDWSEVGVNWNNQPSTSESYGSVSLAAKSDWCYISLDVTNLVRAWVNGTHPNYGIMLHGPESNIWLRGFYTREGSNPPYLYITYDEAAASIVPYDGVAASIVPSHSDEYLNGIHRPSFTELLFGSGDWIVCLDKPNTPVCFIHR